MTTFTVTHLAHLHPPYGLWVVSHRSVVIGKRISRPSQGDCEVFLAKHVEGARSAEDIQPRTFSYHRSGVAATKRAQRRGGRRKRAGQGLAK